MSSSNSRPSRTSGNQYARDFLAKARKHAPRSTLENLEEYAQDLYVDQSLGLRLFHAGINPHDETHYRHQLYVVVENEGKASRLLEAETIVANALCLQYSTKTDVLEALMRSVDSYGSRVLAGAPIRSNNRCGRCGHDQVVSRYHVGHLTSPDENWSTRCCDSDIAAGYINCCKCLEMDAAGTVTPLDSQQSVLMPKSNLPTRITENNGLEDMALAETSQSQEKLGVTNNYCSHTFNVDQLYLTVGSEHQLSSLDGKLKWGPGQVSYLSAQELQDNQSPMASRLLPSPDDEGAD